MWFCDYEGGVSVRTMISKVLYLIQMQNANCKAKLQSLWLESFVSD